MTIPVYVTGYPRSGTAWVARLLGEALNSPVLPFHQGLTIASEGLDRPGPYQVFQCHLLPAPDNRGKEFLVSPFLVNPKNYNGERIIHVLRDPRAVAVSVMFYWNIGNLTRTISRMCDGGWPVPFVWTAYVDTWINSPLVRAELRYEQLSLDTCSVLAQVLAQLDLPVPDAAHLAEAVERQSISELRRRIEREGDAMPYGKNAQRNHARRGQVGDWRKYFDMHTAGIAEQRFGAHLRKLGYENDPQWWTRF